MCTNKRDRDKERACMGKEISKLPSERILAPVDFQWRIGEFHEYEHEHGGAISGQVDGAIKRALGLY